MALLRFRPPALLCVVLLARLPAAEAARPWMLPPLEGELAGEFTPLFLPGAPPVRWKLNVHTAKPRERTVGLTVEGPGLKLQAGAVLDPLGEGAWTLPTAEIDLEEWFGWVAPWLVPAVGGASLSGTLTARGEGAWRDGRLDGRAEVNVRDGRYEDPVSHLVVEGLALHLAFSDLRARRTAAAQVLTWHGGHYATVPFGPGRVEFALDGETVRIAVATLAIFGGELETGEVRWSANQPETAVTAQVRGIDIGKMLFLLPPVLAAAQGRLDGHIALRRDAAGLQLGVGHMALRRGETAELRFAPTPGLLSARLPAAVRERYTGIERLETGAMPLRADVLEVNLTPAGDEDGRTAVVRIEGGPVDPELKAPVVLEVNVRGPLDSLVKFGTDSRLRFKGSR